jgi:probable selenium-dependent hydroxylase accessory protein YqeC
VREERVRLAAALGIRAGDTVAFAGAGGKSSAIVQIAQELRKSGMTVIAAPTTKMFLSEAEKIGPLVVSGEEAELVRGVKEALAESGTAVAGSELLSKKRVGGVAPETVGTLAGLADITLVEADGARRRPLKGTAEHEPVLPAGVTLVVAVGGIRALGRELSEEVVHRPEVFSGLTGIGPGHTITPEAFAQALVLGSLRNTPEGVRRAALITGTEPGRSMFDAAVVARQLRSLGLETVVGANLPEEGPVGVWAL